MLPPTLADPDAVLWAGMRVLVGLLALLGCKGPTQLTAPCREELAVTEAPERPLEVLVEACPALFPDGCPAAVKQAKATLATKTGTLQDLPDAIAAGGRIGAACLEPRCSARGSGLRNDTPIPEKAEVFIDRCGLARSDLLEGERRAEILAPPPLPPEPSDPFEHAKWFEQQSGQERAFNSWFVAELVYLGGKDLEPKDRALFRDFLRRWFLDPS